VSAAPPPPFGSPSPADAGEVRKTQAARTSPACGGGGPRSGGGGVGRATAGLAALLILASPAIAARGLAEPAIRDFVARQEAAWNARDVAGFAATFTPDAVFVDQSRNPGGGVTPNGSSTRAQAMAQARRFFAAAPFHEGALIDRIEIAADGRTARVVSHAVATVEPKGRPARRFCASTEQSLVLTAGRILSKGQVQTDVPCRR
jgi:uncharacterized protein (TIGR02246 family)